MIRIGSRAVSPLGVRLTTTTESLDISLALWYTVLRVSVRYAEERSSAYRTRKEQDSEVEARGRSIS